MERECGLGEELAVKRGERVDNLGIENDACQAGELFAGFGGGDMRPVGATDGHHIVCVGHADDPGKDRDLVPAQAIGESPSVPSFMVAEDGFRDRRVNHVHELVVAGCRMFTEDPRLLFGQLCGFLQKGRVDTGLSDVVDQGGKPEAPDIAVVETDMNANGMGELCDACAVIAKAGTMMKLKSGKAAFHCHLLGLRKGIGRVDGFLHNTATGCLLSPVMGIRDPLLSDYP